MPDIAGPYSIGSDLWPGLSRLIEEAGEVMQVAGKVIGGGGETLHYDGSDLGRAMAEELADLLAAIMYVRAHNGFAVDYRDYINDRVQEKFEQYQRWDVRATEPEDRAPVTNGDAHKCSFPCNPPGGTMWAPGPCTICGKTWDRAQAERALAEAQAAMAATEATP